MEQKKYSKLALINSFWNFLELLLRKGSAILITLSLAWLLVPEDFGLVALVAILLEVSLVLVGGGFVDAMIQKRYLTKIDLGTIFFTNVSISLALFLFYQLASPWIASLFDKPDVAPLLQVAAIAIVLHAFSIVPNGLMRKRLLFKLQLKVALPSSITAGLVAILLAYLGYGVWAIIAQMIVMPLMTAILYARLKLWRLEFYFSWKVLKRIYRYTGFLVLEQLFQSVFRNLFPLLIAKLFSVKTLGLYYFAQKINDLMVSQIMTAAQEVSFPIFVKIQEDPGRLKEGYSKVVAMVGFVLFPALLFMAALAPLVFEAILPDKWQQAASILQVMLLASIFYPLIMIAENIFKSLAKTDLIFYLGLMTKALTLAMLMWTYSYGIEAMLWGQMVVTGVAYTVYAFLVSRYIGYGLSDLFRDIFVTLSLVLLIAFSANYLMIWLELHRFFELVLIGLLTLAAYLVLAYLVRLKAMMHLLHVYRSKKGG